MAKEMLKLMGASSIKEMFDQKNRWKPSTAPCIKRTSHKRKSSIWLWLPTGDQFMLGTTSQFILA